MLQASWLPCCRPRQRFQRCVMGRRHWLQVNWLSDGLGEGFAVSTRVRLSDDVTVFTNTLFLMRPAGAFIKAMTTRALPTLGLTFRRRRPLSPGKSSPFGWPLKLQGALFPMAALHNMARVTQAGSEDPLFSWRDSKGDIHPLVKKAAMERVNEVLEQHGWSATFGHPFHISGAS